MRRAWLAAPFILPAQARAQVEAFPSRPLWIISPVGPSSSTNTYARFHANELADFLGKPVAVDNKPGADGAIAARAVLGEPPDGHTLLAGTSTTMAVNLVTLRSLPYDPLKDFSPIGGMFRTMTFLLVPANSLLRTVQALVARGR